MGLFGDSSVLGTADESATSQGASGNAWLQFAGNFLNSGGGGVLASGGKATSTSGGANLNTSGWVVGEGDASGGGGSSIPWYAWAGVGLVLVYIKLKQRKGGQIMAVMETAAAAVSVAKGLFGKKGSSDTSSATSGNVYLNSSGWVVGKGNATGGGFNWSAALFAALALYTVYEFKKLRG